MTGFADDDEELWDAIVFNTISFENLRVEVTGAAIDNKLDVKDGQGTDGGTVTPRGSSPRKFQIVLQMWTREHRRAWEAMQPLIGARPGKTRPQPVVITYPSLGMHGLTQAWVDEATIPKESAKDLFEVTLQCVEFLPPKPAAKKPAATSPRASSLVAETRGIGGEATGRQIDLRNVPPSMFRDDLIPPREPNIDP